MNNTMLRAVIYTGGEACLEKIPERDKQGDYVIAADCGMEKSLLAGVMPDLLVGDFDSMEIPSEYGSVPVYRMPAEKDETDTMTAAELAIRKGVGEIFIVGGTGGRADHALSNIFLLENIRRRGIKVTLCDGDNRIRILLDETVTVPSGDYRYFSILAIEDCRVTVSGAKYPLTDALLTRANPYAVSNEPLEGGASVTLRGCGVLIESEYNA